MNLESPFFNILSALDIALKIGTQTPHSHESSFDNLISILKLFQSLLEEFEKYNENNPSLGYTSLAVFNRLERIFRKTASVLDNCCKPGRRVYNVVRFPVVLKSFTDVVEEMEECTSCPPFSNVRGSVSLSRQVDALTSKIKQTSFVVDPPTQLACNEIELMVMQHKRGMSPGLTLIRRLGKYFNFRTSEEILEEGRVLSQEQSIARMMRNHLEEEFLSHVASLLVSIQPEESDVTKNQHSEGKNKAPWAKNQVDGHMGSPLSPSPPQFPSSPSVSPSSSLSPSPSFRASVPSEFLCPLTLEIMTDPVIVASGQTYERASIRQWFEKGNDTCPITRQKIAHSTLIPNFALKSSIASWHASNGFHHSEPGYLARTPNRLSPFPSSPSFNSPNASPIAESTPLYRDSLESSPNLESSKSLGQNSPGNASPEMKSLLRPIVSRRTVRSSLRSSAECSSSQSSPDPSLSHTPNLARTSSLGESSTPTKPLNLPTTLSLTSSPASSVEFFVNGLHPAMPSSHAKNYVPSEDDVSVSSALSSLKVNENGVNEIEANENGVNENEVNENEANENGVNENGETTLQIDMHHKQSEDDVSVSGESNSSLGSSSRSANRNEEIGVKKGRELEGLEREEKLTADEIVMGLNSMNMEVRYKAAVQVRKLTKSSDKNRKSLASAGAVKPLLSLLRHTDVRLVQSSIFALLNLSVSDINKVHIISKGGVASFVKLLTNHDEEVREGACAVLFSLSFIDACKMDIAESGAVPYLLQILDEGSNLGKEDAICTLYNLSIAGKNRWLLVRESVITKLVALLSDPTFCGSNKAVSILSNLCTIEEGREELVKCGGVTVLCEMVEYGNAKGKEDAAAALLLLCMQNEGHRALIWKEDILSPLMILSNKGTARAKVKAKVLLKELNSSPSS